jgi:hypothetical protein
LFACSRLSRQTEAGFPDAAAEAVDDGAIPVSADKRRLIANRGMKTDRKDTDEPAARS